MLKSIIVFLFLFIPLRSLYSQEIALDYFTKVYINLNCKQSFQLPDKNNSLNNFSALIIPPNPSDRNSTVIDSIIISNISNFKDKITVKYTDAGFVSSYKDYYLQDNQWLLFGRISYKYDSQGNIIVSVRKEWINSKWVNATREEYTYDTHSNIILETSQNWQDDSWENSSQVSTTFNSIGDSSTTITEKWNVNSKEWNKDSRLKTYYYPNKLRATVSFELYSNSNWQPFLFSSFNYDDNFNLSSILHKKWDGSVFNNFAQATFNYSTNKQQKTLQLIEFWKNDEWINYSRNSYIYNSENYFDYGLCEYWIDNQWISGDGIINIINPDGFELHYFANEAFIYYSKITNVVDGKNIHINDFKVFQNYPNPFNPTTTIEYQIPKAGFVKLAVYNMLGQKVATLVNTFKAAGKYQATFNTVSGSTGLPSGIYVYKIQVGDFTSSKKMMLLK